MSHGDEPLRALAIRPRGAGVAGARVRIRGDISEEHSTVNFGDRIRDLPGPFQEFRSTTFSNGRDIVRFEGEVVDVEPAEPKVWPSEQNPVPNRDTRPVFRNQASRGGPLGEFFPAEEFRDTFDLGSRSEPAPAQDEPTGSQSGTTPPDSGASILVAALALVLIAAAWRLT